MTITKKIMLFLSCIAFCIFAPVPSHAQEALEQETAQTPTPPPTPPQNGSLMITSDPVGSDVYLDGNKTCVSPCRFDLPSGKHTLTFKYRKREDVLVDANVTDGEQTQIHAVLGEKTPWKLIIPTYFVGAVFTAGGLSSILVHGKAGLGNSTLPADESRFHRNLGVASLVIGVPLLTVATYLVFAGKKSSVRTSIAPMTDSTGTLSGLNLAIRF